MHDPISIIMCVIGIVGCVIGVATYASAQMTRAKEDGVLMAKVDHLVSSLDELKKETNKHYSSIEEVQEEHTKDIVDIKARVRNLEKEVFHESRD